MKKQHDLIAAARERIKPKQYSELLGELHLEDIHLSTIKATLFSSDLSGKPSYTFKENVKLVENVDKSATVEVRYALKARSGQRRILHVDAVYSVRFSTTKEIPEDFFVLYSEYSLPLQTFPYFRECANSMLSRMGLPPLILPLRKFLVGSDK